MDKVIKDVLAVAPANKRDKNMEYVETIFEDGSVKVNAEVTYQSAEEARAHWLPV